MELPFKRTYLRRILMLLWLPSIAISLPTACLLLLSTGQEPEAVSYIPLNQSSGSLFAAAPPRSSVLGDSIVAGSDERVSIIRGYLEYRQSPMVNAAPAFVSVADKYDLDWRLLVAMAGKESSFGKYIPTGSYNAWGWGIWTGQQSGIGFSSWEEGIESVGHGLRKHYFNQGYDTLLEIESKYTPPSAANPEHPWATGVGQFMAEIENFR